MKKIPIVFLVHKFTARNIGGGKGKEAPFELAQAVTYPETRQQLSTATVHYAHQRRRVGAAAVTICPAARAVPQTATA